MLSLIVLLQVAAGYPVHGVWVAQGYPGDWNRAAAVLAEAGVDHVLPCLLYGVTPAYPSALVPESPEHPPDREWIEDLFRACRERGIQIHAWVVMWRVCRGEKALQESFAAEGRLQVDSRGDTLLWLCPTDPRNLVLQKALIDELMDLHHLDGVQLDYIRYPGERACYCHGCGTRFHELTGIAVDRWPEQALSDPDIRREYGSWQRGRITHTVSQLSREIRSRGLVVSAAVLPDYADALGCGQDWALWSRRGLLDMIYPMNYFTTVDELETALEIQAALISGNCFTVCGLGSGIGRLGLSPEDVADQTATALSAGSDGVCHFHLNSSLLGVLERRLPGIRGQPRPGPPSPAEHHGRAGSRN